MSTSQSPASTISEQHKAEVESGQRFQFGKNWSKFLKNLNDERIALAERSLQTSLGVDRLDGLTFLDVGSGSGLFSLVARRLGAKVHSFDYDTYSFACTQELRRRYFRDDPNWTVQQGSVLDRDFLSTLGTFDIVYSWGVLHHTGAMYDALANVKPLTPVGGRLFIAIYNDQGAPTDEWARIKKTYNALPWPLSLAYALKIIGKEEWRAVREQIRRRDLMPWIRTWTEYAKLSTRGMSRWHDWIDWVGGYPYERATVEQIVDFYAPDGFRLEKLIDRSSGYGCNEFVFRRVADVGTYVDSRLTGGNSMARRVGYRVTELARYGDGATGVASLPPGVDPALPLFILADDRIVGTARRDGDRLAITPTDTTTETLLSSRLYVVAAEKREMPGPFHNTRGKMWETGFGDLAGVADNEQASRQSNLFVFENGVQLPLPHAIHDDIDKFGGGRFSHWNNTLYFAAMNGDDPNTNGKTYVALVAVAPAT